MDFLLQLLAFIITILLLVSVHEAGHFFVAKALGIKVLRYAIGFGKPLYRYKGPSGTEYIIGYIPLGGYVKLLDEREVIVPESEKAVAFNRKPLWMRTLVVLAGSAMNLIFAILSLWMMYMIGVETIKPVVGGVVPDSIVAASGIKPGDIVRSVDGNVTPSLQKVVLRIVERVGEKSSMQIQTESPPNSNLVTHELNLKTWSVDKFTPDPLSSLGIIPPRPFIPAVIKKVEANSPGERAGLQAGDLILSIGGVRIANWYDFITYIQKHPNKQVVINIDRNSKRQILSATIGQNYSFGLNKFGYLGVQTTPVAMPSQMKMERKYPPFSALGVAVQETFQYFKFNFIIIKKMVMGQLSLGTLGGPIAIFQSADLAFKQGLSVFLGFLALISIMLAFINILPIPGLDGGHLFNYLIEFIIRRPVPLKYEIMSIRIGFFALLLIMIIATLNDLLRLFLR